ncbi:MAG: tetratricopeptide repeat protein, partial [Alphaproteobacteria bacterium]|nr:tetratricopeptide repeat protein [Alphaproteobacteria bacterium]
MRHVIIAIFFALSLSVTVSPNVLAATDNAVNSEIPAAPNALSEQDKNTWKLAHQGIAKEQLSLGLIYVQGRGVAKDEAQAAYWYRKAAEQGYAQGQFYLGTMYQFGSGVTKDDVQAVNWYRKAAEQGYADGQYSVGVMYDIGRGVTKDEAQAAYWYRKAAEQGHSEG